MVIVPLSEQAHERITKKLFQAFRGVVLEALNLQNPNIKSNIEDSENESWEIDFGNCSKFID